MSANFDPKICKIDDVSVKTRGGGRLPSFEDKIIAIGEDKFHIEEKYREHRIFKWTDVGWKMITIISTQTKGLEKPTALSDDAYHDKLWDKSYSIAKRFSKACYK